MLKFSDLPLLSGFGLTLVEMGKQRQASRELDQRRQRLLWRSSLLAALKAV